MIIGWVDFLDHEPNVLLSGVPWHRFMRYPIFCSSETRISSRSRSSKQPQMGRTRHTTVEKCLKFLFYFYFLSQAMLRGAGNGVFKRIKLLDLPCAWKSPSFLVLLTRGTTFIPSRAPELTNWTLSNLAIFCIGFRYRAGVRIMLLSWRAQR